MKSIWTCILIGALGWSCKSANRSQQPQAELENAESKQSTCKNLPASDYRDEIIELKKVVVNEDNAGLRSHWVNLNTGKTSYQALDQNLTLVFTYADAVERKAIAKEALQAANLGNVVWGGDEQPPKMRSFHVLDEAIKQKRIESVRDVLVHILSAHSTIK